MVNTVHPEMAGKTLAMLNFELPGYDTEADYGTIASVPEFASMVSDYANSELSDLADTGANPEGISGENEPVGTMEDGVSYRFAGIPYFLNGGVLERENFVLTKYHTEADDETTYHEETLQQNINIYGAQLVAESIAELIKDSDSYLKNYMK